MKRIIVLLLAVVATAASSCTYQKYNTIDQDIPNQDSERIYGVHPDSSARQLKNVYTEKPELQKKANDLRDKMFPKDAI
ncbi:MAG: hypothetical protein ACI9V1_001483 [Spirosomataceae bacterium]|jgi:hypothetical protein